MFCLCFGKQCIGDKMIMKDVEGFNLFVHCRPGCSKLIVNECNYVSSNKLSLNIASTIAHSVQAACASYLILSLFAELW